MSRRHGYAPVFPDLWLLQSFCSLFYDGSCILGEKCDIDILYVAEISADTYFLPFDKLWASSLTTIHCTEKLFWWGLRGALIWCRERYDVESNLILSQFSKIMLVHLFWGLWTPSLVLGQVCDTSICSPVEQVWESIRKWLITSTVSVSLLYQWAYLAVVVIIAVPGIYSWQTVDFFVL